MNFNIRLKNIRKRSKTTQKSISDYLGITLRTYQRYEEGTIEPPLSTVVSIAKYFNLPVDCLLGNGLFDNWEEILLHKDNVLSFLKDNIIPYIPILNKYDLSALTESQLASILPAIFTKITIEGSHMNFFSQIPADDSSSPIAVRVDES